MGVGVRSALRLVKAIGVFAGLAYAAYRLMLTDEAREDLCDGVRAVRDSWECVEEAVGMSPESLEAERFAAQEDARRQWRNLGY